MIISIRFPFNYHGYQEGNLVNALLFPYQLFTALDIPVPAAKRVLEDQKVSSRVLFLEDTALAIAFFAYS